jgi:hypothetical protein
MHRLTNGAYGSTVLPGLVPAILVGRLMGMIGANWSTTFLKAPLHRGLTLDVGLLQKSEGPVAAK